MKIAYLYVRVSTDEQADRGYSQRDQHDRLKRYCEINDVRISDVIFEDHSAKTFKRPAWIRLLKELRKKKGRVDYVYFTKWDRFSRNAGDAYMMINVLRTLGIEPQAIEQPLDLTIPENKIMLAFYLASPEVENDRRALNTTQGMRRAKKEGRYMGVAPIGYTNKITEDGKKYIAIVESEAALVRWAFEQIADGEYAADHVRKQANKRGMKCGSAYFWKVIRNPVYAGKIEIPKYKDEEAYLVDGQHEAIISETLYYRVQDILNGRAKGSYGPKMVSIDLLPLRGLIVCPACGRMLTGSASKGYSSYYNYYHCQAKCKTRFKAEPTNEAFFEVLKSFKIQPEAMEIYENEILAEYYETNKKPRIQGNRKEILKAINAINVRLGNARNKYYSEETDVNEYRAYKAECEVQISRLESQLTGATDGLRNIDRLLNEAIKNVEKLDFYWKTFNSEGKRRLISSFFPGKIHYDGKHYRTERLNEAIEEIYLINSKLRAKKMQESEKIFNFPAQVAGSRIELPTSGL